MTSVVCEAAAGAAQLDRPANGWVTGRGGGHALGGWVNDDVMMVEDTRRHEILGYSSGGVPCSIIQRHLSEQPPWVAPAAVGGCGQVIRGTSQSVAPATAGGRGQVITALQGMLAMGRLLGLALRHRKTLDVRFSGAFLSMLVGGAVSLEHLEEVDEALHRSLCWLLNEKDSTKEMDLVFTVTETDRVEEPLQPSLSNHERSRTDADRKKAVGDVADVEEDELPLVLQQAGGVGGGGGGGCGASGASEAQVRGAESVVVKYRDREVELVKGGAKIAVTEKNKAQYVAEYARFKLAKAEGLEAAIKTFRRGMFDVLPSDLLQILSAQELELMLCGMPVIDVSQWKASACYSGYTANGTMLSAASQLAVWFWDVVEALPQAERALLLKFSTGSAAVPSQGFEHLLGLHGEQRFTLAVVAGGSDRLPLASTCFNLLKLPEYSSKALLEERLHVALHYGSEGFTFS